MKYILLAIIKLYRRYISPLKRPSCRFVPTCSEYAAQAINKYGAAIGLYFAIRRLIRCNPWSKGGWDPVP